MLFRAAIAIGCVFLTVLNTLPRISAQNIPPCGWERETTVDVPWAGDGSLWCVERVVQDINFGAIGFYHITTDDGSLYTTLPELNAVAHIIDTDGDLLPDTPKIILETLTRPVGIDYYDGALYIAGNANLYRYDIENGALVVLADDIPWGWTGYPTAGVLVHDGRIYVTVGGDEACTAGRGAVYSYALDGTDRERVAEGIMAPADVAWMHGALWVADTDADRLLQLVPDTDYGACSGAAPDVPEYIFAAGSAPVSLAAYTVDVFPQMQDTMLVALQGDIGNIIVEGYDVVSVSFDAAGNPTAHANVVPVVPEYPAISEQKLHIQASGFYPNPVYGVGVGANGWVYVTVGSGRVYGLRPLAFE
jgi:glucose/arabinose dehydrogenase